ncbi:hypothetical protein ASF14_01440 [Sphingomonas sp. Leaf257]|nr:hypothetical protein ASF14_01440 [Sphingomonas sp. Leaf257]
MPGSFYHEDVLCSGNVRAGQGVIARVPGRTGTKYATFEVGNGAVEETVVALVLSLGVAVIPLRQFEIGDYVDEARYHRRWQQGLLVVGMQLARYSEAKRAVGLYRQLLFRKLRLRHQTEECTFGGLGTERSREHRSLEDESTAPIHGEYALHPGGGNFPIVGIRADVLENDAVQRHALHDVLCADRLANCPVVFFRGEISVAGCVAPSVLQSVYTVPHAFE